MLGSNRANLARLNRDGSLDLTFNPQAGTDGDVQAIGLDASGNIMIAGLFGRVNGKSRSQVARLKPDGTLYNGLTNTFSSQISVNWFTGLLVQPDATVVLTGSFQDNFNGNSLGIIRLNTDGSLDSTFVVAVGGQVNAVANQSDGKLIIAGPFTEVQRVRRLGIARLNSDGSLDSGFNVDLPLRLVCGLGCRWVAPIETVACQRDDKVIIGGTFTEVQGIPRKGIARLLPDGSLDLSFDLGSGLVFSDPNYGPARPGFVRTIALQADGKVVFGGQFTSVNGVSRWGLARVRGDENLIGSLIYFAAATYSFSEDSAFAIIRVDRLGNINSTVSVDFATADGTASAGLDYWPANDRLTFLPGQTIRYLALPIIEDATPEPDRTVHLTLANPSAGAALGLQTMATLRILDNQRPGSLDWNFEPGGGPAGGNFYNPTDELWSAEALPSGTERAAWGSCA